MPTWQWLPVNLDGASVAEVAALPRFHSVAELRGALAAFARDPAAFQPRPADVARAVERLFGAADGREGERIADRLRALLDGPARPQPPVPLGARAGEGVVT